MRIALKLGMALFLAIALWQGGSAFYIYGKAQVAQYLLQSSWQETIEGKERVKPWPWADTWPVARMRVPTRDIDLIILAGAHGSSLAFGPGHMDGSVLPGEVGNSVIGGHRDTHLAFLQDVAPQERFEIQRADGVWKSYEILEFKIVNSRKSRIPLDSESPLVTLVTCYPFDAVQPGGPWRYVVTAQPITK